MVVALVGISGSGKSYYTDHISENFNFKKVNTLRSRKQRKNELENNFFVSNKQIDDLIKKNKIILSFYAFNNRYAYLKDDLKTKNNMVLEMHYENVNDLKKIVNDLYLIYIIPKDINLAREIIIKRNLSLSELNLRLNDLDKHLNLYLNNIDFRNSFDFIVENKYDINTTKKINKIIKNILRRKDGKVF